MTFLRPELAAWALAIPAIIACWAIHRHFRDRFAQRLALAPRFASLSRRSGARRDRALLLAGVLSAGSLSLALMRPQAAVTRRLPEYERQDLVIMLDRSVSMQARDVAPSRSGRATLEMRNFVRHKPAGIDRLALIGFADAPLVLSYLTEDANSLLFFFDWIDSDPTPLFGTNIGAALGTAMDVADKDERATVKLFLVISDGEDFGSELERAIVRARSRRYRVNCSGIGSPAAVPIPLPQAGAGRDMVRDDTGRPVLTRFSENTLRRIASATGGQYARSTTGEELQRAIASIVDGERRVIGWRTSTEQREIYPLFLAVAAAASVLLWVLL